MIQRIQSVYLLLTTLSSVLFLCGNILKFIDDAKSSLFIRFTVLNKISLTGGSEQIDTILPLAGLIGLTAVASAVAIFLYKKRKLQMRLTAGLIGLIVLLILTTAYYAFAVSRKYNAEIQPGINLILPVLMLIFACLAYRGIKKDNELVKSYDRLR